MKQVSRLLAAAGLAVGAVLTAPAQAALICANCLYGSDDAVYLGTHNPLNSDASGFRREDIKVARPTFVTDTWLFRVNPAGTAQVLASFEPIDPLAFSQFNIKLYSASITPGVNNCGTAIGNSLGTTGLCDSTEFSVNFGDLKATSSLTIAGIGWTPVSLAVGTYAFVVSYTANVLPGADKAQYSGQLSVRANRVPEPGTLALAGLALMGVAASVRRQRKA